MNTTSERIICRMKELNLSQVDLVNATGFSKGTVSKWISGINTPSGKYITALASVLKTSPEWILVGDGSRTFEMHPVSDWDDSTPVEDDEVEVPFFKDFSFACGNGSIHEIMANEKRKLRMSKFTLRNLDINKNQAVAATASGDSMMPTIKDGDTIHIDLGRKTIKDGKIFVVCLGGLFYCKRLYNLPFGGVRIVSDNSDEFPEIQLTAQQIEEQEFNVIGWIWQIATMEKW